MSRAVYPWFLWVTPSQGPALLLSTLPHPHLCPPLSSSFHTYSLSHRGSTLFSRPNISILSTETLFPPHSHLYVGTHWTSLSSTWFYFYNYLLTLFSPKLGFPSLPHNDRVHFNSLLGIFNKIFRTPYMFIQFINKGFASQKGLSDLPKVKQF